MSDPVKIDTARSRQSSRSQSASWMKDCLRDERRRIISNVANVMMALREAPELLDAFAFDEMLAAPILMKELRLRPAPKLRAARRLLGLFAMRT